MSFWPSATEHEVHFLGASAKWVGGGAMTWLGYGLIVLVFGLAFSAVPALLIAWAVNDIIDHGVTWLPVFALVVAWNLVQQPGSG